MPSLSGDFIDFSNKIGLRPEHAEALWKADIHNPQELGSMSVEQLRKVCDNSFLINNIHPLLKKHVFNISMANNPFEKALSIIRKYAAQDDDEDMDTSSERTNSDAVGYMDHWEAGPRTEQPTEYNNTSARVRATGNGTIQTNVGDITKSKKDGFSISISGGNFVQANVMGQGPVTYNNTNTYIGTSIGSGDGNVDLTKLRAKRLNESILLDGRLVQMRDFAMLGHPNFWLEPDFRVAHATMDQYMKLCGSKDVYQVNNFGSSQALIINNYEFNVRHLKKRTGADRDSANMTKVMQQCGFEVEKCENKSADDIRQTLREFAKSTKNIKADMVAVYIGSHGERDENGKDRFLGVNGNHITFEEVKEMFDSVNSPFLKGKPKLFFLQFCRADSEKPQAPRAFGGSTQPDASPCDTDEDEAHSMTDMLCVFATLAGNRAYRDTMDGSWFVTALVKTLIDNAYKDDLLSILTKVNNSVAEKEGIDGGKRVLQVSEVVHSLRRKVYMWPGMK